jgi:DNA-binding NarL/FixJ family response regulator
MKGWTKASFRVAQLLPLATLSNNNDPRVRVEARRLGCAEYLVKSQTTPRALAKRVADWVRSTARTTVGSSPSRKRLVNAIQEVSWQA